MDGSCMSGSPPGVILCHRDTWQYLEITFIATLGTQEFYWHRQVEGRCAASILQCKGNPTISWVSRLNIVLQINHVALMDLKTDIFLKP